MLTVFMILTYLVIFVIAVLGILVGVFYYVKKTTRAYDIFEKLGM